MKKYFLLLIILFSFAFIPAIAKAAILSKPANNLGLVGYWAMNEGNGTIAGDKSGNGNNGTLTGATIPTWADGKRGKALNFDGSASYVDVGNRSNLKQTGDFTVSAWVFRTTQTYPTLIGWDASYLTNAYYLVYYTTDNSWHTQTGGGSSVTIGGNTTSDTWHYLTVVFDKTNSKVRLYLDGSLDTATDKSISISYSDATDFQIGKNVAGGTQNWKGSIDDVRIYNRALSATEVAALYRAGEVTRKVANNQGLVGYWSFNEGNGTVAGDSSGNGNNGTLSGTALPTWTDGKRGKALRFDGINNKVLVSDNPSIVTGPNPFSYSLWFNATDLSTLRGLIGKSTAAGYPGISGIFGIISSKLYYQVKEYGYFGNTTLESNIWYHVVFVWDGTTEYFYLNGALDKSLVPPLDYQPFNLVTPFTIGNWYPGTGNPFAGLIDDVRIYNRALSATEIQALYKTTEAKVNASQNSKLTNGLVGLWSFDGPDVSGTTAYDRSGQGNTGTMYGGVSTAIGKVGQALSFDGSTGYVGAGSGIQFGSNDFTISVWVYPTRALSGDFEEDILKDASGNVIFRSGGVYGARAILFLNGWSNYRYSGAINTQQWNHIVFIKQGQTLHAYVNGILSDSSLGGTIPATIGSMGNLGIGYVLDYFEGRIDDVRIYNRALTVAEVKQLYDMGR